jgi:hypothetical protein
MANTDITLVNDGGVLVPSAASVPAVSGDSVSFSTNDGSPVVLFFSPDATSILSPKPSNPFSIAAGKAVFTFSSSAPGAYSVYFGLNPESGPGSFPNEISHSLVLEIGLINEPPPFTGPKDTTNPGS